MSDLAALIRELVAGNRILANEGVVDAWGHISVRNPDNPDRVAMRWGNKITTMKRVETSSGAERLEHEKRGLVFIGIPAKAMLLDAKKGRQLANDCMSPEQLAAQPAAGHLLALEVGVKGLAERRFVV